MPTKDPAKQREYCRKSYHKNLTRNRASKARRQAVRIPQNRIKAWNYLLQNPCACGESDPIVLDFDHDDPATKEHHVAVMINGGWSWKSILQEISKCTVRCSNCHRRKTAKQFGYYAWLPTELAASERIELPCVVPETTVLPLNEDAMK
jgi:hypothetical protein